MNHRILAFAALVCCAIFARPAFAESPPFTIGVFVCQTGVCADWGTNSVKGIELAVEEINAAGGILGRQVKIKLEDSGDGVNGAQAVAAFEKLTLDPSIEYFIGPTWTTGGLPVIPNILKRPHVIVTSPSLGVPDFDHAGDNIFNVWPHDQFSSEALARYAISQGWKRAAILSSQDPWCTVQGNTFETEYKRLGGTVTAKLEPLPTLQDPRLEITKIKYSEPDVVFFSSYYLMGVGSKQLRQIGYKGHLMTVLMNFDQLKLAAGAMEGTIYARYPDATKDFAERFEKRFGVQPSTTADTAYDTVRLYQAAIEKSKTFDTAVVRKTLQALSYSGASGEIQFDEFGGVRKAPILYRVKGAGGEPVQGGK